MFLLDFENGTPGEALPPFQAPVLEARPRRPPRGALPVKADIKYVRASGRIKDPKRFHTHGSTQHFQCADQLFSFFFSF